MAKEHLVEVKLTPGWRKTCWLGFRGPAVLEKKKKLFIEGTG